MRPDIPPDLLRVVDAVGLDQQVDEVFELAVARKAVRDIRARKLIEDLRAIALEPRLHPAPERRVRGERQDVRQKVAHRIHDADRRFAVLDAHMHVQTEDQVGARHQLQILNHLGVARVRIDLLRAPVGKGMRRSGHQHQVVLLRQLDHLPPQIEEVLARLLDRSADARAHLDHRLVHLGLDALFQPPLALGQHLGRDVRAQIARHRIDGLVFLFNADRERRTHR